MIKSVVVGLDYGPRSDHALRVGLDLSGRFDTRLSLVHAIPPPPSIYASIDTTTLMQVVDEAQSGARGKLTDRVQSFFSEAGRDPASAEKMLVFEHGDPAHVLVDQAVKTEADVIVIGPHERHGVWDFGRTVRGVLSRAPGSVWVQKDAPKAIKKILVPIDMSEPSLASLTLACELAKSYGASIEALHCFHQVPIDGIYPEYTTIAASYSVDDLRKLSKESFDNEMAAFDWGGVAHETRFVNGEPVATIKAQQDSHDLIVLSTHGRSGLRGVILGNVAYSVLKDARIPVLAMRRS
jgi:nucleotide-binding universal stress UspA family protein